MQLEKQETKNLDNKELDDLFDFSDSQNKSPDIKKEKQGFSLIKGELGKLSDMKDAKGKMSPESIDHAFFAYTGKEVDKLPKGPDKQKVEELRKNLLILLQGVKDPREKLVAISEMRKEWIESTGTVSGGAGEKDKTSLNISETTAQVRGTELQKRMKEFQDTLRKIEEEKRRKSDQARRTAENLGNTSSGNSSIEFARKTKGELDAGLSFLI